MCILASTSREEVFQTICSLVMFFERQMVMELFSKSRHCNYWASHSGLLLDGSMWFHVQRWSKLSQTYSVTNTQFSQPMSGIVKDFSCSSWSWWWKGQPSHCQLLQPPQGGGGVATFIVFSQRRLFVQGIIRFFSWNPRRLRQSAEPLNRRTLAAKAQNFSLKMLISCSNAAASDKRWLLYQLDRSNWWSDSASDGTAQ